MTDEAKALVAPDMIDLFRIIRRAGRSDRAKAEALAEFMQLIETQAREIERLREALGEIMERGGAFGGIWCALAAQETLAGDSHDQ